ncbi:hypothetical protein D3C81_1453330 [compost metagenome]
MGHHTTQCGRILLRRGPLQFRHMRRGASGLVETSQTFDVGNDLRAVPGLACQTWRQGEQHRKPNAICIADNHWFHSLIKYGNSATRLTSHALTLIIKYNYWIVEHRNETKASTDKTIFTTKYFLTLSRSTHNIFSVHGFLHAHSEKPITFKFKHNFVGRFLHIFKLHEG